MSKIRSSFTLMVTILFFFSTISSSYAQSSGYLEDEGDYLWEEQEYQDATGREFETSDSQYVGEQEIKEMEEAAQRAGRPSIDLAAALEKDKELLPDNIIYGIGTGAVIGGWLALVQGRNARDNIRFLSVGVITGILLGMAVGSKSLYIEQAPPVALINPNDMPFKDNNTPLPFQFGLTQIKYETVPQVHFQIKF